MRPPPTRIRYIRYCPDGAGFAMAGGVNGPGAPAGGLAGPGVGVAVPAAAAGGAPNELLKYLKNSELGESTMRVLDDLNPAW